MLPIGNIKKEIRNWQVSFWNTDTSNTCVLWLIKLSLVDSFKVKGRDNPPRNRSDDPFTDSTVKTTAQMLPPHLLTRVLFSPRTNSRFSPASGASTSLTWSLSKAQPLCSGLCGCSHTCTHTLTHPYHWVFYFSSLSLVSTPMWSWSGNGHRNVRSCRRVRA